MSKFIEDAVKWLVFDQTTTEAREAFTDLAPESLQDLINEAKESVRNDIRKTLVLAPKKEH